MTTTNEKPLIGIVGPCSAGKSTLIAQLKKHNMRTRQIAQEHSHVKDMWQRLTNPDILIFLDVSYATAQERRKLNWNESEHATQEKRLRHAREHADIYLLTDGLTPDEIFKKVFDFIKEMTDA